MADEQVPKDTQSEKPDPEATPKRRRRWPWILSGLLAGLILLILLAPTLLSLGPFQRMILRRASAGLNGSVAMDAWSLGWFSGFEFEGIRISDAQGEAVAEVGAIRLPASVFALLSAKKTLGRIEILSPRANLVLNPDGTSNLAQIFAPKGEAPTRQAREAEAQPLGIDVACEVVVSDGHVRVQAPDAAPFEISGLNAHVKIHGLNEPIAYKVDAGLGKAAAPLTVEGSARIMQNGVVRPDAAEVAATVSLHGFDLGEVASLARRFGAPLDFAGRLDVQLAATARGAQSAEAKGTVAIESLALAGGPLGEDRPQFDRLALDFDVVASEGRVRINRLRFESPVAGADASGSLAMPSPGRTPAGSLKAQARVDLAALARQLPHTLKLQEGLSVESGVLTLDATIEFDEKAMEVEANVRVADLAATQAGRSIAPEAPIVLHVKGGMVDGRPELAALRLDSSFAQIRASGNADRFALDLASDLDAATREAAKFVDLRGKALRGRAAVTVRVAPAPPHTAGSQVAVDVRVDDLQVLGLGEQPIAEKSLTVTLKALAPHAERQLPEEIRDMVLELKSSPATATIAVEKVAGLQRGPVTVTGAKVTTDADLGRLLALARVAAPVPADLDVKGTAHFSARASFVGGMVKLSAVEAVLRGLELVQAGKVLRESEIRVTTAAELRPDQRTAAVENLVVTASSGTLSVADLQVADWARLPDGIGGRVSGRFDLAAGLAQVRDFARLPADLAIKGTLATEAHVASAPGGALTVPTMTAVLTGLEFEQAGKRLSEKEVRITAAARASVQSRTATLENAELVVSAGTLRLSNVRVPDWSKTPDGIAGRVAADFDLARALKSVKDFATLPEGVTVAGTCHMQADVEMKPGTQDIKLAASLDSVKVTMPDKPAFEEKRLELSASAQVAPAQQIVKFSAVRLASSLLDLQAKGSFRDWADQKRLTADGTLACDFDRIGPLVVAFTGQKIELSGKRPEPFHVDGTLKGKDWREILGRITGNAGMYVQRVKFMGIETGEIPLAVRTESKTASLRLRDELRSSISATIATTANRGQLMLAPVLDVSGPTPLLTLPKDARILTHVQLTDEMAEELLSRAVPLFTKCLRVSGAISVECSALHMPLDDTLKQAATLSASLTFEQVEFTSGGWLDTLLDLVKLSGRGMRIPDQRIAISLKDGRFRQERMQLMAGKYPLLVSGSVGLDSTLDTLLELPITRDIVQDKTVYELLKDQTLKVRITGTAAKPKFDRDIVRRNLRSLIKDASKNLIRREGRRLFKRGLDELFKRK